LIEKCCPRPVLVLCCDAAGITSNSSTLHYTLIKVYVRYTA